MRKIWLPGGIPGLEAHGTAYRYQQTGIVGRGKLALVGTLAVGPEGTGIPFRHRHTTGFEVDKLDTTTQPQERKT